MHGYIDRFLEKDVKSKLNSSPIVAILGPRQCGKSTLAKKVISEFEKDCIYLDLQKYSHINMLNEPELFFEKNREKLICLDEIQLKPELFSFLRSEIDEFRTNGRFLVLGSASRDLIKQSSETLAGRLSYLNLTPFLFDEVKNVTDWQTLLLRGGFPDTLLANNNEESFDWRENFIRTFLERDIPQLGFAIPIPIMEKLWRLLAHYHGQTVNYSKVASIIDVSVQTLKKYLAILEQTYMLRFLPPFESNLKKRIVKSPKLYLKDSGILNALHGIETYEELLSHPIVGSAFEGFAIENIISKFKRHKPYFLRSSNGAEIDLILEKSGKITVFEFKMSKSPKPSRGFYEIVKLLKPQKSYIIAPVDMPYQYNKEITISNLNFSVN